LYRASSCTAPDIAAVLSSWGVERARDKEVGEGGIELIRLLALVAMLQILWHIGGKRVTSLFLVLFVLFSYLLRAQSLACQGKYDEAVAMERDVLAAKQRVLGADHPDTLTSADNLAASVKSQRGQSGCIPQVSRKVR